ncbi:hypothetical protein [Cupriavidus sp. CuC1]|uniref:hypothetical protein n=1 Tax=Cupriavidus sp. CuC1 TaxID=3373131 RepID=UPI0037D62300
MTSIVCWMNPRDYFPGMWAVSDSRVCGPGGILTENCPKLFAIHANCYRNDDFTRTYPKRVLSFGFGFAGSTLIGANVKEMLATFLGELTEVNYYDAPDYPFEERVPSLAEIAEIARKLTERYIASVGIHYPAAARCELVLFGFCRRSSCFKVFRVSNSAKVPASVTSEELPVGEGELIILGDRKDFIRTRTLSLRSQFAEGSWNWLRAPIITLSEILRNNEPGSIGGYLQLCSAFREGFKHLKISLSKDPLAPYVGFDVYREIGTIGGFLPSMSFGLVAPGPDGWPE